MVNRYSGELRINPIAVLRDNDFNNDGAIADIDELLEDALKINAGISEQMKKLRDFLRKGKFERQPVFRFADGGYIEITGLNDEELLRLNQQGLIDLFDLATERDWVKKYGAFFGLVWEDGRAVEI